MKKKEIMLALVLITFCSQPMLAGSNEVPEPNKTATAEARSVVLTQRLVEINEIDQSSLSFSEKRVLRKEVKSVEKELKRLNGGVYLSAGAIILIILLLIILL